MRSKVWRYIERLAAWLLIPLLFLVFLSGYAILHWRFFEGVLSKPTAFKLHSMLQPLTLTAFVIHGFSRMRRGLARYGVSGLWLDGLLIALGSCLIAFSIYFWVKG